MIAIRPTLCAAAASRAASPRIAASALTFSSATASVPASAQTRSFSVLPRLRPTASLSGDVSSVFRSPLFSQITAAMAEASIAPEAVASSDLARPSSVSRHPALAGLASQIRFAPRATMARTSRLIQKRRHGFLSRIRTKSGRKTLARRRAKGRKRLAY